MHNAITRLRLRSILTLPAFARETRAISEQAGVSPGFIEGAVLAEGRLVFWTRTVWEGADAMKAFRDTGAHRASMPKLLDWCDEACVANWQGEPARDWSEIYRRLAERGRSSRVRRPSKAHEARRFAPMWRWSPEQSIVRGK
jgi:hypothetical protein